MGTLCKGWPRLELLPSFLPATWQAGLGPSVTLFLSDVETDAWPAGSLQAVAARTARTLVTLGDKGAHEYEPGAGTPRHIPPIKVGGWCPVRLASPSVCNLQHSTS